MKLVSAAILAAVGLGAPAMGQTLLFDFDNAPAHSPLSIDVTVSGVTAHLSATGQGYSVQPAGTLGFTPVGFAGNCIYPSSVYAADLLVGFSRAMTDFSIMYSPQELGCDDSARMRVTAYMDGAPVGTALAIAPMPGTWPTGTLSISAASGFNSVVVHYDARPPTCQDYGPIFLADNMTVTVKPLPVCRADFNSVNGVTVQDIFDFLAAWFAGDPRADFNGANGLGVQDIFDFLNAWFTGCP